MDFIPIRRLAGRPSPHFGQCFARRETVSLQVLHFDSLAMMTP